VILVLIDSALNLKLAVLNLPLPSDLKGTLKVSLAANASTIVDPWQPFFASPTEKVRL
jgi:hypothetical protein